MAEGIDFKKPEYPDLLADVSGMSRYEPWGRWTDDGDTHRLDIASIPLKIKG